MKNFYFRFRRAIATSFALLAGSFASLAAGTFTIDIRPATIELRPGLTTTVWSYNGTVPGTPIVSSVGERVVIKVKNDLDVPTNIHWHGLELPNDQDGPMVLIKPGESFTYDFVATTAGTYWYHSHQRPVLEQMDMGLYGAFIVKDPADARYSGDHTYVLDDWFLDANGERLPGTARGMMERLGNVETVNGRTGTAIEPLSVAKGELHKLRFISASTAAVHTIRIKGHQFRVTHTDGHPLVEPYFTDTLTISPGERYDVELEATGEAGKSYEIVSANPKLGIRIPVVYGQKAVARVPSPFVAPAPRGFPGIATAPIDKVLTLSSGMGGGGSMGGMMGMGGMNGGTGMVWTINGKAFPNTEPITVKVGQVVKLRLRNNDLGMMHPMDHPIHIHGAYFQVVSLNGEAPDRETWKDTISVPAGQYIDIAFVMRNPGEWMLHCHIIDHEDNGMMTTVVAKP